MGLHVGTYTHTVKVITAPDVKESALTDISTSLTTRRAQLGGQLTAAHRWGHGDTTTLTIAMIAACAAAEIDRRAATHHIDLTNATTLDAILDAIRGEITAHIAA